MIPKKKRQDYTADAMREAMDDVQLNNLSIRGSAKLHNIPESTLRGRLSIPINNCACVSSKIPFIKNGSADDIVCELFRCTIYKGYLCFLSIDIFLRM
jgi:hypothetical protein